MEEQRAVLALESSQHGRGGGGDRDARHVPLRSRRQRIHQKKPSFFGL